MEAPIAGFLSTLGKREFLDGAHRREMLGYPVSTVEDIAADPQLQARGFWQDVPAADGRMHRHCGAFFRRRRRASRSRRCAGWQRPPRRRAGEWRERTSA